MGGFTSFSTSITVSSCCFHSCRSSLLLDSNLSQLTASYFVVLIMIISFIILTLRQSFLGSFLRMTTAVFEYSRSSIFHSVAHHLNTRIILHRLPTTSRLSKVNSSLLLSFRELRHRRTTQYFHSAPPNICLLTTNGLPPSPGLSCHISRLPILSHHSFAG